MCWLLWSRQRSPRAGLLRMRRRSEREDREAGLRLSSVAPEARWEGTQCCWQAP